MFSLLILMLETVNLHYVSGALPAFANIYMFCFVHIN